VCRRAPAHAAEALEVLGGNGYVEESPMPRLFRESPLNGIWEGAGNVIALDVLRALGKWGGAHARKAQALSDVEPESLDAFLAEVELAAGEPRLDAWVAKLKDELPHADELGARRLVERMALALQGSLLVRHAPPEVADAFCASRLAGDWGRAYGTLPSGLDLDAIVTRAIPHK
jgi:putative acyl-CoA dehydrogenase